MLALSTCALTPYHLIKSGEDYFKPTGVEKKDDLMTVVLEDAAVRDVEQGLPVGATPVGEGEEKREGPLKVFKLCKFKDRFAKQPDDKKIGYRDICLGLEVGWKMESEAGETLDFVHPRDFGRPGASFLPPSVPSSPLALALLSSSLSLPSCSLSLHLSLSLSPSIPPSLLPSALISCTLAYSLTHSLLATALSPPGVRTHICEVQILLQSMYDIKIKDGHKRFVAARNLLSQ
jgi:hypothetical protein